MRFLPHFIPPCNTIVVIHPTFLEHWTDVGAERRDFQGVSAWEEMGAGHVPAHGSVQICDLHGALRRSGGRHRLGGPFRRTMWKGFRQGLRRDLLAMLRAAALTFCCAVLALTAG